MFLRHAGAFSGICVPGNLSRRKEDFRTIKGETCHCSGDFGGTVTALAVNVETYATHIDGLPVAVNIGYGFERHDWQGKA